MNSYGIQWAQSPAALTAHGVGGGGAPHPPPGPRGGAPEGDGGQPARRPPVVVRPRPHQHRQHPLGPVPEPFAQSLRQLQHGRRLPVGRPVPGAQRLPVQPGQHQPLAVRWARRTEVSPAACLCRAVCRVPDIAVREAVVVGEEDGLPLRHRRRPGRRPLAGDRPVGVVEVRRGLRVLRPAPPSGERGRHRRGRGRQRGGARRGGRDGQAAGPVTVTGCAVPFQVRPVSPRGPHTSRPVAARMSPVSRAVSPSRATRRSSAGPCTRTLPDGVS
ncbi:hypothetical protein SFUMM280S_00996 [Streptomyces fumanus]